MLDMSHCKMNQFFMKDFQAYYDYQEQNQQIIDEYIVKGSLGWESLNGFDMKKHVKVQQDGQGEWESCGSEEEFEDEEAVVVKEEST